MDKIKGYVYILTNKSFRDDWVKIGKSSRPVDVRIDPSGKAQRPLYGSIPRSTSSTFNLVPSNPNITQSVVTLGWGCS